MTHRARGGARARTLRLLLWGAALAACAAPQRSDTPTVPLATAVIADQSYAPSEVGAGAWPAVAGRWSLEEVLRPHRRTGGAVRHGPRRLAFSSSATWIALLAPPLATAALHAELSAVGGGKATARIEVGAYELDLSPVAATKVSIAAGGTSDLHLPFPATAGHPTLLVVRAETPDGVRLVVETPELVGRPPDDPPDAETTDRQEPTSERPDVLLVILDAARPDHLSFAGYPRPTSPSIDRLAAESVVFPDAYALCASTSCSIPNLLTGSEWTTDTGPSRAGTPPTLAERLRAAGYRTLGYSANGYNDIRDGFDEFSAAWERPGSTRGDPGGTDWIVARAGRALSKAPRERPLFVQVHLLPPHEPYIPTPDHDVFGDPAYSGPIRARMPLKRLRGSAPAAEDLAELIALYDGNLRRADAAVGKLLEVWRRSGRWDSSVVALTADHGEAFYEHGVQGHNTTVYEEMLRVPLIVKPPRGWSRPPGEAAGFAMLTDVAPTLLGLVGLGTAPGVDGRDLFDAEAGQRRAAWYFSGTALGARFDHWKAVFHHRDGDGARAAELFDLSTDRGERHDLSAERPLQVAAHALWLRAALGRRSPASSEGRQLTDAQRDQLRSLGYVD